MKYFLGLALAVLPAFSQSPAIAPLALYTEFRQPPAPGVVESIRQELADIMAPLGFPFQWWSLDGRREYPPATELAVVTFRGNCTAGYLLTSTSVPGPLGFTHITDGQVIPFAEVDCNRVRDYLRAHLIHSMAADRERLYGRAVGRVLAHELFHVFARTAHHGSSGVAESVFTREELMTDQFQLGSSEFHILRGSLKQARLQNGRIRSAASPVAGRFIFQESGCASCHGPLGAGTRSAPALRGALADVKAFGARLATSLKTMPRHAKTARANPQILDDDEIADVFSFLNGSL